MQHSNFQHRGRKIKQKRFTWKYYYAHNSRGSAIHCLLWESLLVCLRANVGASKMKTFSLCFFIITINLYRSANYDRAWHCEYLFYARQSLMRLLPLLNMKTVCVLWLLFIAIRTCIEHIHSFHFQISFVSDFPRERIHFNIRFSTVNGSDLDFPLSLYHCMHFECASSLFVCSS